MSKPIIKPPFWVEENLKLQAQLKEANARTESYRSKLEAITYETGCHIGCYERGTLETCFPYTATIQAVDAIARAALAAGDGK